MKIILILLLLTQIGWADNPNNIATVTNARIEEIESQLSDANKAINLLVQEDKLLQNQIEQLDYRVDILSSMQKDKN